MLWRGDGELSFVYLCGVSSSCCFCCFFFFSSRRRHTRLVSDWSSDVCSSDLVGTVDRLAVAHLAPTAASAERIRAANATRSEERRVGKECRSRGSPYH